MRGRKAPLIELSQTERQELLRVAKRHGTPQQIALRARIVFAAAEGQTNDEIARQEAVAINTVRRWRTRWLALQSMGLPELSVVARLCDAPRVGRPGRITAAQYCQLIALACELPAQSGRPISQWSARELADEVMARGIVAQISPRHTARLLKKGICNRTASAAG